MPTSKTIQATNVTNIRPINHFVMLRKVRIIRRVRLALRALVKGR